MTSNGPPTGSRPEDDDSPSRDALVPDRRSLEGPPAAPTAEPPQGKGARPAPAKRGNTDKARPRASRRAPHPRERKAADKATREQAMASINRAAEVDGLLERVHESAITLSWTRSRRP